MDRNRLKEVHQSDLTESRINEDFVTWLKDKGPTYLLVVLVVLCAYVLLTRWKEHKQVYVTNAWAEYSTQILPSSLEDVAIKYEDVGALPHMARLDAAQRLLRAVQTGEALGQQEGNAPIPLTDEERTRYLSRADGLYLAVLDSTSESEADSLVVINALFGRAAVAESRNESEQALGFFQAAEARSETYYPSLAEQARARMESLELGDALAVFPVASPISTTIQTLGGDRDPIGIDPVFLDLITPDTTGQ